MRTSIIERALIGIVFLAAAGVTQASVATYVSPEQLSARSPVIVEGVVVRIASGYDPEGGTLATYVTIAVETVHRGPDDLDEVVVREPGGRHGDTVHVIDAVPVYRLGERVFVFLEPGRDGVLRTTGMFFGKFSIAPLPSGLTGALRDLSARGTVPGGSAVAHPEPFLLSELASVALTVPFRPSIPEMTIRRGAAPVARRFSPGHPKSWEARPPGWDRLLWDDVRERPAAQTPSSSSSPDSVDPQGGYVTFDAGAVASFTVLSPSSPARWHQADSSTAIVVNVERARDPLGDATASVWQIQRAMEAWSDVPESRLALVMGDDDAQFTANNSRSPVEAKPPLNIVLFGDPYDDISDPSGCSGVLAVAGYWRSWTPAKTVNGVTFYPATRLYTIFNNDFECWLGNPETLAEVATHELGHGVGFGHSAVSDAIMRSYAYGARGPRLGADDLDGAHCHYPHDLDVVAPDGGENWAIGAHHEILWSTTPETGDDPGTVTIELSIDDGQSWSIVAGEAINDGTYTWTVPASASDRARIRVRRPNRIAPTPSPYPASCSAAISEATFAIGAPLAGSVPDGSSGVPLTVERDGDGGILLTWGASCSNEAQDYAVYEGSLDALRAGVWDHMPVSCSGGTDLSESITPRGGARYYLIAAVAGAAEGALGVTSGGDERPAAALACRARETTSCDLSGSGEGNTGESPFPHLDHP